MIAIKNTNDFEDWTAVDSSSDFCADFGNQQYLILALTDSSGNVSERYAYTRAPSFPAGPMKKTCGSRSVQIAFALVCSNTLPGKLEDSGKWKPLRRDDKRCFPHPGISIDLSNGGNPPPLTFVDETPASIGLIVNYCCCDPPSDFVTVLHTSGGGESDMDIFE